MYGRNIFSKQREQKPLNADDEEWNDNQNRYDDSDDDDDDDDEDEEEKYDNQILNDWHIRKAAERERKRK